MTRRKCVRIGANIVIATVIVYVSIPIFWPEPGVQPVHLMNESELPTPVYILRLVDKDTEKHFADDYRSDEHYLRGYPIHETIGASPDLADAIRQLLADPSVYDKSREAQPHRPEHGDPFYWRTTIGLRFGEMPNATQMFVFVKQGHLYVFLPGGPRSRGYKHFRKLWLDDAATAELQRLLRTVFPDNQWEAVLEKSAKRNRNNPPAPID
jgi:hypothetical protein